MAKKRVMDFCQIIIEDIYDSAFIIGVVAVVVCEFWELIG